MLEQRIEQELKQALLAGDSRATDTLRGLKSALLYEKVAKKKRDTGLSEDEEIAVLSREAKKRQESADLYRQGGSPEKAEAEEAEKKIIERFLPAQLSESELAQIVDKVIAQEKPEGMAAMGKVIGLVKAQTAGQADGSLIARLVKERLA